MRIIFLLLNMWINTNVMAQTEMLGSKVYRWDDTNGTKTVTGEFRPILKGSTLDLSTLKVHASILNPGQTNHVPRALYDVEELILVKEGRINMTINGTTKTLGAGSIIMVEPGDEQSCSNPYSAAASYYVLAFIAKDSINTARGKMGGGSLMMDWDELEVKQTDKGESRPLFDRPTAMFPKFDVHATALNPGISSHAAHTHRAEEIILMIKGNGEMQIGETMHKAKTGDLILVNANVPHAFTNTGTEQCGYYAIQWHN